MPFNFRLMIAAVIMAIGTLNHHISHNGIPEMSQFRIFDIFRLKQTRIVVKIEFKPWWQCFSAIVLCGKQWIVDSSGQYSSFSNIYYFTSCINHQSFYEQQKVFPWHALYFSDNNNKIWYVHILVEKLWSCMMQKVSHTFYSYYYTLSIQFAAVSKYLWQHQPTKIIAIIKVISTSVIFMTCDPMWNAAML